MLSDSENFAITIEASIDVLPSKNQALCEFCTHVNHC